MDAACAHNPAIKPGLRPPRPPSSLSDFISFSFPSSSASFSPLKTSFPINTQELLQIPVRRYSASPQTTCITPVRHHKVRSPVRSSFRLPVATLQRRTLDQINCPLTSTSHPHLTTRSSPSLSNLQLCFLIRSLSTLSLWHCPFTLETRLSNCKRIVSAARSRR